MGNQSNTILGCEDHQIVIDGLVSSINNDKSYKDVGAVNDGGLVVQEFKRFQLDIILLDLKLPNKN
uniref:response regulator n=1 Tax=Winogradskyella poriferorum TaxID=307627 RepID=UPI003D6458DA